MRIGISRKFAKLYNERPHKPIKIPHQLRQNLRSQAQVRLALRQAIKEAKANFPHIPLSDLAAASKAEVKAFYKIPEIISLEDPKIEKPIRNYFKKEIFDTEVKDQSEYLESNLFLNDKSIESKRNVLLVEESEAYLKQYKLEKEEKRIKELEAKIVKFPELPPIDDILNNISTENDTTQEVSTHVTDRKLLSFKGVLDFKTGTGKYPTFNQLSKQELKNYAVHNLQTVEQALQMAASTQPSDTYDSSVRILIVQKLVELEAVDLKDKRMYELVSGIDAFQLGTKDVCDTLWALGKIYGQNSPKFAVRLRDSLKIQFLNYLPKLNSMNLAYACKGFYLMQVYDQDIADGIMQRLSEIIELVPMLPNKTPLLDPPIFNIPLKGHSLFYGYQDLTIPKTILPAKAVVWTLKYLSNSPADLTQINKAYAKCAELVYNNSLYELSRYQLLEAIGLYGSIKQPVILEGSVVKFIKALAKCLRKYIDKMSLSELCTLGHASMNCGDYGATSMFRAIELKAKELLGTDQTEEDVEKFQKMLKKYYDVIEGKRAGQKIKKTQ